MPDAVLFCSVLDPIQADGDKSNGKYAENNYIECGRKNQTADKLKYDQREQHLFASKFTPKIEGVVLPARIHGDHLIISYAEKFDSVRLYADFWQEENNYEVLCVFYVNL